VSEPSSDASPLDALAEEFVARYRAGEHPALDEFVARRPDLEKDIRDLFPALVLMEGVRPERSETTGPFGLGAAPALKRLGDFRILREVGRGGMGIVYEAEQESLGRHVALKVLPAHAVLNEQGVRRFHREAKAAARLHHTNIVPVYGVGEAEGLHYYVMQFIQGLGLDQVLTELRKLRKSKSGVTATTGPETASQILRAADVSAVDVAHSLLTGRFTTPVEADAAAPTLPLTSSASSRASDSSSSIHLPGQSERSSLSEGGRQYWQSVARIGVQVAEALAYANAHGTLHRDIKPSNLLLDTQGTVWVADFGLAKAADSEDLTHAGDIVGTIRYMAPERFSGQSDARSDIYSLGLTLYELLILRPAFEESDRNNLMRIVAHESPPPPRRINSNVPRDLETIVLKAITRDPAHRYATPAEMAADLRRFLEDKPIRARRVSAAEKAWRWCRRNPAMASLTAAVLLLLILGAVGSAAAAYHFSKMAKDAKRLEGEALAAKKDAEDKAEEMRAGLDRLNRVNALTESAGLKGVDGHWDEALGDYVAATELRPDVASVWLNRGAFYMQFYQWDNAADDYAKGFDIQPSVDPSVWQNYAAVRLYRGDVDGYRQVCQRMLFRFGQATDPKTVDLLARTCSLGPDAVGDWSRLEQMTEKAFADNPDSPQYLGSQVGVLLRSGQPESAVRRYEAFLQRHPPAQWGLLDVDQVGQCMLALAYQQSGKPEKAAEKAANVNNMLDALWAGLWQNSLDSPPQTYLMTYDPLVCVLRREVCKQVQSTSPEEPRIHWLARSRGHAVLKQWGQAAAEIERAIVAAPDDYLLRTERGRLYVGQKRWEQAAADFAEAIRQHPDDARVWFERGRMFALQERWSEAAADFHQAIDKPENTLVTAAAEMGGQVTNIRTESLQWEPVFTELTRLRPTDGDLWMERGRSMNGKGKWADAIGAFTKAIEIQPDNVNYLSERGALHVQESQWDPAAADYVKMLDLVGDKPELGGWKQNALNAIVQNDKILTKAVELKPENLDLLTARANWHAGRNESELALQDYARVLDKAPDRLGVYLDRGRVYASLGRWEEAAADFTKGLGDGALNDDWFQLAALHLLAGHAKEYEEHCRKTIKLREEAKDLPARPPGLGPGGGPGGPGMGVPGGPAPYELDFHAGRILSLGPAEGEAREQGAQWAERAVAAQPNHPSYLHSLALAHFRAGRFDKAVERLQESQKVGANWRGMVGDDWGGPLNPLLRALCFEALKQPEAALAERQKADKWLDKINHDRPKEQADLPPPNLTLADWLEYHVLRREAEKLPNDKAPDSKK
jgi:serine/threonine protein kinase/Flp pilus assembly protein TadD